MEIRSVTLFCEPAFSPGRARSFFEATAGRFPYPLQTRRVALPPFPDWWTSEHDGGDLVQTWKSLGADYLSAGPVLLRHGARWLDHLPTLLGREDALFASAEVADTAGHVDIERAHAVAGVIRQASTIQPDGFGNLYFTASANCPPGSPFFPVAYHSGGAAHFALAVEAADLATEAIGNATSLEDAQRALVAALEGAAARLTAAAEPLAEELGIAFSGIDFSLAPFPEERRSLAAAMEALGLSHIGAAGSLFAAAFIADAIGRAAIPRCGFSGLMFPVLEDNVLAARASAGKAGLSDLLSYAAVCGAGLDTVPLPGDVSTDVLAAILLDVSGLALRLNKPLTARLMPLPGLAAGDPVHFDFPYFADSRVLAAGGTGTSGLLREGRVISVSPYQHQVRFAAT
ncbi:MAG: DUF711 family protein [Anaerolineae bacterium]|nr:DUF711 family protein [Anaerolineae bacterium]